MFGGLVVMEYIIQVYDITKRKTFETLQQWVTELKNQGPESIIIAIAGNKSDLESERQVFIVHREEHKKYHILFIF